MASDSAVKLELHPVPSQDALLVKAIPPRAPCKVIHHVPCDIILVVDVSKSMDAYAPVPGETAGNFSGLSVLDLVKHAALTMIENLDERDRLGVVTFSETATALLGLTSMTEENKVLARAKVRSMVSQSTTNLWAGIETSLGLAKDHYRSGAVPAIIVLTDGVPNLG